MTATRPALRIIAGNEYRRERWRNGAGWTRAIHAQPDSRSRVGTALRPGPDAGQPADWIWRLSIAEIEFDGAYSRFDGVEREQVLLSGNGLQLHFDDGATRDLLPPHQALRFAGERAVSAGLVDGRVEVFNLMWRRDAVDVRLWRRPLVGAMVLFVDPGTTWAVHLLGGHARVDGVASASLAGGDTALLEAPGRRTRHVLDGGGEVLLARIGDLDRPV
ncbi:HutD family protein [Luteimonas sp. BDR2-5]|uniref:HutD/Ves family protein n=1 Tax=Proluteimonas luteida TaxID=2878685 RepID=UPI001E4F6C40|nr:HutD family protein [Luteimonas sp. BDR2-5]MCD9029250.1 HutD family protein [Luteimonas sp. BDR2-5]